MFIPVAIVFNVFENIDRGVSLRIEYEIPWNKLNFLF